MTVDRWDVMAAHPELHVCSMPETTEPTIAKILAVMPETGDVLDLGCGPGRLAVPVAQARPGLHVTALDISPAMIARAPRHPHVDYQLGDGLHLPDLPSLAGAWSVLLFQHLPPDVIAGYLAALSRQLHPGAPLLAQFIIGDYHLDLDHRYPPMEIHDIAQATGLVDVAVYGPDVAGDWGWLHARSAP